MHGAYVLRMHLTRGTYLLHANILMHHCTYLFCNRLKHANCSLHTQSSRVGRHCPGLAGRWLTSVPLPPQGLPLRCSAGAGGHSAPSHLNKAWAWGAVWLEEIHVHRYVAPEAAMNTYVMWADTHTSSKCVYTLMHALYNIHMIYTLSS